MAILEVCRSRTQPGPKINPRCHTSTDPSAANDESREAAGEGVRRQRRACNVATPIASYCNYTACMAANVTGDEKVVWVNEALNFDNLLEALMTARVGGPGLSRPWRRLL